MSVFERIISLVLICVFCYSSIMMKKPENMQQSKSEKKGTQIYSFVRSLLYHSSMFCSRHDDVLIFQTISILYLLIFQVYSSEQDCTYVKYWVEDLRETVY